MCHDIAAFFDSMDHGVLKVAARRWGFNEVLLEMALALYGGPRHLHVGSFAPEAIFARRGVVPGCALCTTLAKVYAIGAMDAAVALHPAVQWSIFVDDIFVTAHGADQERWCCSSAMRRLRRCRCSRTRCARSRRRRRR